MNKDLSETFQNMRKRYKKTGAVVGKIRLLCGLAV
jgi:hypothetical protein